jgi:hypothetical protein
MSESTGVIPQLEETDTEIELSTQELLALSQLPDVDRHEAVPALQPSKPEKLASLRKRSQPLALIAAVSVVGTAYVLGNPDGATQSAASPSPPMAQSKWSAPQQFAAGEPVRFANPFDTDEVFEFPPGTTENQARDAVAEILLKRAMSRQQT